MRKRLGTVIVKLFMMVYAVCLVKLIFLCINHSGEIYDLAVIKKWAIFLFGGTLLICLLTLILYHLKIKYFLFLQFPNIEKIKPFLLPLFLCLYAIVFWILCTGSRGIPVNDSGALYKGALYMAGLSEESNWPYFAHCSNNTMGMIVLSLILRVATLLHIGDVYYAVVFYNLLQLLLAMYCTFRLCERMVGKYQYLAWGGC